jgi:two-component system, OmpR family, sensor histidine kinase CiaH
LAVNKNMAPQKKLAWITFIYWFLLLYIIAALVWWFIALNKQADVMTTLRISQLDSLMPDYDIKLREAQDFKSRKVAQYVGEGSIFLLLILLGAVFVFRSVKKQLRLAQQQQNFMMAVTHELKTPIAATRLNLETLQRRKLDEEKQRLLISTAIQETDRLNDLTNNILLASRIEGGEQQYQSEWIDVQSLLPELKRQIKARYPSRDLAVVWEARPDLKIRGDELMLKILMSNLLDNAMKYTGEKDWVALKLSENNSNLMISVSDTGQGIPNEEKNMIFEKFYRMGSEKNRTSKGTGLGLYLCRMIVTGLSGSIWVEDNHPKGSVFVVQFPKKVVA